jgi:HSP20 family molecular chaperone IbpA
MTDTDPKEIKVRQKEEVATPAEQTRPGAVFAPRVDIYETDTAIVLKADIPGVKADDLNIDLRDNVLTLVGDVLPAEGSGEESIVVEYETGRYYRQFTLSEVIDQGKIDAKLRNGVLELVLPKVEKATPRKIAVKSA